jgi:hypothetical protein
MNSVVHLFTIALVLTGCATVPGPTLRVADVAPDQTRVARCDFDDICGSGTCDDGVCRDPIPRPNALRDGETDAPSQISAREPLIERAPRPAASLRYYPGAAATPPHMRGWPRVPSEHSRQPHAAK